MILSPPRAGWSNGVDDSLSPSPAGGRGGRGVRVVTAQTQAPQIFTHTDRMLAHARCSPSPAGGQRGAKQLIHRLATSGYGLTCLTCLTCLTRLTSPPPNSTLNLAGSDNHTGSIPSRNKLGFTAGIDVDFLFLLHPLDRSNTGF
jgi:hypothetical protein